MVACVFRQFSECGRGVDQEHQFCPIPNPHLRVFANRYYFTRKTDQQIDLFSLFQSATFKHKEEIGIWKQERRKRMIRCFQADWPLEFSVLHPFHSHSLKTFTLFCGAVNVSKLNRTECFSTKEKLVISCNIWSLCLMPGVRE